MGLFDHFREDPMVEELRRSKIKKQEIFEQMERADKGDRGAYQALLTGLIRDLERDEFESWLDQRFNFLVKNGRLEDMRRLQPHMPAVRGWTTQCYESIQQMERMLAGEGVSQPKPDWSPDERYSVRLMFVSDDNECYETPYVSGETLGSYPSLDAAVAFAKHKGGRMGGGRVAYLIYDHKYKGIAANIYFDDSGNAQVSHMPVG